MGVWGRWPQRVQGRALAFLQRQPEAIALHRRAAQEPAHLSPLRNRFAVAVFHLGDFLEHAAEVTHGFFLVRGQRALRVKVIE
jgi:hypothetical protein